MGIVGSSLSVGTKGTPSGVDGLLGVQREFRQRHPMRRFGVFFPEAIVRG